MKISDFLDRDSVVLDLSATSKKQVLQEMAKVAAGASGHHMRQILDILLERERLGTTGVGNGVAIPHGRLGDLDRLYGVFARLATQVAFDAIDDQPVDLVFMLLAPEDAGADHLRALSRVSRMLRDHDTCARLRNASSGDALCDILLDSEKSRAA
ncbi:MAG: PTS IIA-like nitrogen regulatory protein PtsN [Acetobacterales bacterium]